MEMILVLGALFLFFGSIILPWVNRNKIYWLREDVDRLNRTIKNLEKDLNALRLSQDMEPVTSVPIHFEAPNIVEDTVYYQDEEDDGAEDLSPPEIHQDPEDRDVFAESVNETIYEDVAVSQESFNFERQFGAKLPVWIGGIALALGAFYLVKYSIDNNLLSPAVRVLLGEGLGIVFLFAADRIRKKADVANGVRIAQSLSGAGIAALYVSTFAAAGLYHFVSDLAGLGAMAVITGAAVTLSLRHGAPIALLGLTGGFLSPALLSVNGEIPTPVLFMYLYFIFAGFLSVVKQRRWWWLSLPSMIGTFLWVVYWLGANFIPDDTIWVGLFLLAVSATIVIGSRQDIEENTSLSEMSRDPCNILNYLGLGGAIVLMGTLTAHAGFGYPEWGLFGILAVGGIVLAYFRNNVYGFLPPVLTAVNLVMLTAWDTPDLYDFCVILCSFAALYLVSGFYITLRSHVPSRWTGLTAMTAVGYYFLAYFKLQHFASYHHIQFLWSGTALGLAVLFIFMTQRVMVFFKGVETEKNNALGITSLSASIFITLAMIVELEKEVLSVAVAAEVFAAAWIGTLIFIPALRQITGLLSLVFGFLLLPQILLLFQLTVHSLTEIKVRIQDSVPIVDWPLFQLGLPAVLFIGAAYYLRSERDGKLVRGLELASIALVAVMGYYLNRHAFHVSNEIMFKEAGFFERNVMTNILFAYGICCFYLGRKFQRIAFSNAAIGLCAVALFRVVYFDMFMHNPLWSHENIRGVFLLNELILAFALPVAWMFIAKKELYSIHQADLSMYAGGSVLLFIFIWLNLNVRFLFHAPDLSAGYTTNAETYAYSAVWLLLGISLLIAGVWRKDKMVRYASLGVMILTVGKVFLHDAAELDGLYRVFVFLGLGLSLLGLSYFYTRFVFNDIDAKHE